MKVNIGPYDDSGADRREPCEVVIDRHDLWSLDSTLALVILPALKAFRENLVGYPYDLTPESWREMLDAMIFSFDYIVSKHLFNDEVTDPRFQSGLDLFAENFIHLGQ